MELFDKIYSCYYTVVRRILEEAGKRGLTERELQEICSQFGFQESALAIVPRLTDGTWPFLEKQPDKTYRSRLAHTGKLPLTNLQKSWLFSLLNDPRLRLFFDDEEMVELRSQLSEALGVTGPEVSPDQLYQEEDFYYFDRYTDGDPYESPEYRRHFRTILSALSDKRVLLIAYEGKKGRPLTFEARPCQLQYSSKDDKFRLCCLQLYRGRYCRDAILNLARIKDCHLSQKTTEGSPEFKDLEGYFIPPQKSAEPVLLRISGERNSLERCMLHFANYEKHTEYEKETGSWLCSIYYDMADETELLIDILSFGPVVKVLGPESFLRQVKTRVRRQHQLFYGEK